MKFGVALTNRGRDATAETLARVSRAAEEYGFDSVWVTDHIVIPTRITSAYPYEATGTFDVPANEYYLEPLTVLTYLAGVTHRIRLGTGVLVVPYRNPIILAKMVASLDVLSDGRVILGVGAGWMEEEFRALGLDTFSQRGMVTDETIRPSGLAATRRLPFGGPPSSAMVGTPSGSALPSDFIQKTTLRRWLHSDAWRGRRVGIQGRLP